MTLALHSPYCSKQIGLAEECYICNPALRSETTIPIQKVIRQPYPERLRLAETELVRLRDFVQWVADHSNDPGIVAEARKHGAE